MACCNKRAKLKELQLRRKIKLKQQKNRGIRWPSKQVKQKRKASE